MKKQCGIWRALHESVFFVGGLLSASSSAGSATEEIATDTKECSESSGDADDTDSSSATATVTTEASDGEGVQLAEAAALLRLMAQQKLIDPLYDEQQATKP